MSTYIDRARVLADATQIARVRMASRGPTTSLRFAFGERLREALHEHFTYLGTLEARVCASHETDAVEGLIQTSAMTALAEAAYEAALQALLFGYRLDDDRSEATR